MLKRVFKINELEVEAHQYIGTGPLLVKLPDERGEMKAKSTDYLLYFGGVIAAVVPAVLVNAMALPVEEVVYEEKVVPVGDAAEGLVVTKRIVPEGIAIDELDKQAKLDADEAARVFAEKKQADIDARIAAGEKVVVVAPSTFTAEKIAELEKTAVDVEAANKVQAQVDANKDEDGMDL